MPETPNVVTLLEQQSFAALVSKGIRGLLFPPIQNGTSIKADTTNNILNGYPIGGITTGGDSVDSEEFQDQLLGGQNKSFLGGATDPGDITFTTYFNTAKGKPKLQRIRHSRSITPQFILILATTSPTEGKLQGWFASGVNYAGGNEIKGGVLADDDTGVDIPNGNEFFWKYNEMAFAPLAIPNPYTMEPRQ